MNDTIICPDCKSPVTYDTSQPTGATQQARDITHVFFLEGKPVGSCYRALWYNPFRCCSCTKKRWEDAWHKAFEGDQK